MSDSDTRPITITDALSELDDAEEALGTAIETLQEARRHVERIEYIEPPTLARGERWVCSLCLAPLTTTMANGGDELMFTCSHYGHRPTFRRQAL